MTLRRNVAASATPQVREIGITSLLMLMILVLLAAGQSARSAPFDARTRQGLPVLPKNAAGYMKLSAEQLAASMASKNFILVNVHVPYRGSLSNTNLSIPFDQIRNNLDKLPGKDAAIVLYCRSGHMSSQAARALVAASYTKIYELDGGFNAWKAAGHDLLNE